MHPGDVDEAPEVVVNAQRGDVDAFAEIYRQYRDFIFNFCWRKTDDRNLAEDLTSETFVRAWRNMSKFEWHGKGIGAWLVTIARNLIFDHFKSSRAKLEVQLSNEFVPLQVSKDRQGHPDEAVGDYFGALDMRELLRQITPEQRDVLILRHIHELSLAETAAYLGIEVGAVKGREHRATRALAREWRRREAANKQNA